MHPSRKLFDTLDREWIQNAIDSQASESLHLDFKTLADSAFTRDDRQALSRALSAFLNSDGGMIVYGVDCRKQGDDPDVAQTIRPISGLTKALSRAHSLLSELVSPVHEGVLVRAIPDGEDEGFLVVYAPASESAPHMASDGRYYKRSGSNSVRLEHFDLEDMFGRRPRPVLAMQINVVRDGRSSGGGGPATWNINVDFAIRNDGRGIARFPLLAIELEAPHSLHQYGIDGNGKMGLPERKGSASPSKARVFSGGSDDVIHESTALAVCRVRIVLREEGPVAKPIHFSYRLSADGVRTIGSSGTFDGDYLVSAMERPHPRSFLFVAGDANPKEILS